MGTSGVQRTVFHGVVNILRFEYVGFTNNNLHTLTVFARGQGKSRVERERESIKYK